MPAPTPLLRGETRFDVYDGRGAAYRIWGNTFPTTSLPDSAIITAGEGHKRVDSVIQPVGEERTYVVGPGTKEIMPLRLQVTFHGNVESCEADFNSLALALNDIVYLERENWWRAIQFTKQLLQPRYSAKKRVMTATFELFPVFPQWTDVRVNSQSGYDAAGKRWNKIWSGYTPPAFVPTIYPIVWETDETIYYTTVAEAFRTQLQASGGNGTLVFSKVAGSPDIGISSTGDLLWPEPYDDREGLVTVKVTDGGQQEVTRSFTLQYEPNLFRPDPPSNVAVPTINETTADVTWTQPSDVTTVRVYWKLTAAPTFMTFKTLTGRTSTTLVGLLGGSSDDGELRSFKYNQESLSNPSVTFETLPDTSNRNYLVDSSGNPYVDADGNPYFVR